MRVESKMVGYDGATNTPAQQPKTLLVSNLPGTGKSLSPPPRYMANGNDSIVERLSTCEAEHFRLYFDWRLESSAITKLSSIWTEWKFLRLLYQQEIGRKIDQVVGTEISDVGIPWDPSFAYWTSSGSTS
jgi:hypothetical protein